MVHLTKRISFHTRSNRQITYIVFIFYETLRETKSSKRSIFIIVRIFLNRMFSLLNVSPLVIFLFFSSSWKARGRMRFAFWMIRFWKKISKNIVENWRKDEVNEVTLVQRLHRKHCLISSVFESRFNFYAMPIVLSACNVYIVEQHFPEFLLFLFGIRFLRDTDFLLKWYLLSRNLIDRDFNRPRWIIFWKKL